MAEGEYRVLEVRGGKVRCTPGTDATVAHCRFCVYSRFFRIGGKDYRSPALAFCVRTNAPDEVNLSTVEAVTCADRRGEGYRSMLNVIS